MRWYQNPGIFRGSCLCFGFLTESACCGFGLQIGMTFHGFWSAIREIDTADNNLGLLTSSARDGIAIVEYRYFVAGSSLDIFAFGYNPGNSNDNFQNVKMNSVCRTVYARRTFDGNLDEENVRAFRFVGYYSVPCCRGWFQTACFGRFGTPYLAFLFCCDNDFKNVN